jgi:hypothetical protein
MWRKQARQAVGAEAVASLIIIASSPNQHSRKGILDVVDEQYSKNCIGEQPLRLVGVIG